MYCTVLYCTVMYCTHLGPLVGPRLQTREVDALVAVLTHQQVLRQGSVKNIFHRNKKIFEELLKNISTFLTSLLSLSLGDSSHTMQGLHSSQVQPCFSK